MGSKTTFRIVDGLPYGLMVGADYLRNEDTILDFRLQKGFKHSQDAPWIPALDHTPPPLFAASLTDSRASTALDATHRTAQSHEDMSWEDNNTLEWDVYLSNIDITTDEYVSKAVGGYAVGSMPQYKQLTGSNYTTRRGVRVGENDSGGSCSRGNMMETWHPG